jgi:hypothetical protein
MTLLRDLMLADLERGLAIARDGHEVVPAWRVLAPDGDFIILTRFDPDKPEQRERAFALVPRFMAWKLATGFVLTAETWLAPERTRSGEEAVPTIGVSPHDRMAVIRRIRRDCGLGAVTPTPAQQRCTHPVAHLRWMNFPGLATGHGPPVAL